MATDSPGTLTPGSPDIYTPRHFRHERTDATGQTMRNPHYDDYLGSQSPMIDTLPAFKLQYLLIGVNVVVFVVWQVAKLAKPADVDQKEGSPIFLFPRLHAFMKKNFTTSWANLSEGRVWTLVSAGFSHIGFFHLLVNMLVLRAFMTPVFIHTGNTRFLVLYTGAATLGSLMHILYMNTITPKLGWPPRPNFDDNHQSDLAGRRRECARMEPGTCTHASCALLFSNPHPSLLSLCPTGRTSLTTLPPSVQALRPRPW